MLSELWTLVRTRVEAVRQYPSAVVTAEALVWHHGYKGLDAALTAAETATGDFRDDVRADLVARLAADRYLQFKQADVAQRALLLDRWSRRRGQMIHRADKLLATPAQAG